MSHLTSHPCDEQSNIVTAASGLPPISDEPAELERRTERDLTPDQETGDGWAGIPFDKPAEPC